MTRQDELNEAWCKYMGKFSTEIMQALAFALRWCDEHLNWISVEDELPPKESEYDDTEVKTNKLPRYTKFEIENRLYTLIDNETIFPLNEDRGSAFKLINKLLEGLD